jgi:hypothetical protein
MAFRDHSEEKQADLSQGGKPLSVKNYGTISQMNFLKMNVETVTFS